MTQTKPRFTELFRAVHRPDVAELPEPLPAICWTAWRWMLLTIMLAAGSYYLLTVTYPSIWYIASVGATQPICEAHSPVAAR